MGKMLLLIQCCTTVHTVVPLLRDFILYLYLKQPKMLLIYAVRQ